MNNQLVVDERINGPERRLKAQVLGALTLSLILLLLLGIYAIKEINTRHVKEKAEETTRGLLSLYHYTLDNDARQLASLLESITENKELMSDLTRKDRQVLLEKNQELFKTLKAKYQITHFYFSGPDRVNLVRIHNPHRFGDTINRYTTLEAERRGELFYGIELGKFGMFTLRAVKPIYIDGTLIGFVEFGREIEHIIQNISKILDVNLYITIFKTEVHQETWEEGMRLMGRVPQWEYLSQQILIESTREPGESEIQLFANKHRHSHGDDLFQGVGEKQIEEHIYTMVAPLSDASGHEVGRIWIQMDFTSISELAQKHINRLIFAGILVVVTLLSFLYLVLNRVQKRLLNYREQRIAGLRKREQTKQRHLDEMTSKKQDMEELAERMSTIVDTAMDGIATIDTSGKVLSFNQASSTIFGYSEQEMIGQNVMQLMAEPYKSQYEKYLNQYREKGDGSIVDSTRELLGKHKNGHKVPIHMAISEVRLNGKPSFTCVVHDISDRKRAETAMRQRNEALERSNRELQDFAYIASHDLQEPLRKIRAFGDRLKSRFSDQIGERGLDYLSRMLNAAERMQVLISSLLSYSRVTSQAKPFEAISLNDIVNGVLSDLETRIEETGTSVELHNLPDLEADSLQMRQVFQNLIGNAIKFQQKGVAPFIQVSARPLAPHDGRGGLQTVLWEIAIKDNGIGFDEKYRKRIFEVFERLHSRSNYEGTGIGLAVCRKIVERHDGTISAQGIPGEGAVFTMVLPERHEKRTDDMIADSKEGES